MKRLVAVLLLVGVVGCSKAKELGSNPESKKETPSKHAEESSKNANPVKELTINDVVGSYEGDKKGRTVFLDNGVVENYMLMDIQRDALVSVIKLTEKHLEKSIKEYGIDSVFAKSAAKQLAAQKEKLAAAGPLDDPKNLHKIMDYKWEINDGEVHTFYLGIATVYRMEPNGDLTAVRNLTQKGSRIDLPKEKQKTLKKIK